MSLTKLKYEIKRLPQYQKMVLGGSLFVFLSIFLPWYKDLDAWGIGNQFSALSGPLYLIGFLIFGISIFTLALFVSEFVFHKKIKLPINEGLLSMIFSIAIIFFLIIANSVFFHKDFGVNILRKETRFGMLLCFAGAILIGLGGYFQNKRDESDLHLRQKKEKTESLKPLIDISRPSRTLRRDIVTQAVESIKEPEDINLKLDI